MTCRGMVVVGATTIAVATLLGAFWIWTQTDSWPWVIYWAVTGVGLLIILGVVLLSHWLYRRVTDRAWLRFTTAPPSAASSPRSAAPPQPDYQALPYTKASISSPTPARAIPIPAY
jgi:hypothetical protein